MQVHTRTIFHKAVVAMLGHQTTPFIRFIWQVRHAADTTGVKEDFKVDWEYMQEIAAIGYAKEVQTKQWPTYVGILLMTDNFIPSLLHFARPFVGAIKFTEISEKDFVELTSRIQESSSLKFHNTDQNVVQERFDQKKRQQTERRETRLHQLVMLSLGMCD